MGQLCRHFLLDLALGLSLHDALLTLIKALQTSATLILATVATLPAVTIITDFEGGTLPSEWTVVGSPSVVGGAANSSSFGLDVDSGTNYIVMNGAGLDAASDFSGSFDFYLEVNANYQDLSFWVGDVDSGLSGVNGDYFRVDLQHKTFGRRASIFDADNADANKLFNGDGNNAYTIEPLIWYTASFDWDADTSTFSISWTDGSFTSNTMSVAGHTFAQGNEVHLAFGTKQDPGYFDNISITGETYVVPEASAALLGLVGAFVMLRRRR